MLRIAKLVGVLIVLAAMIAAVMALALARDLRQARAAFIQTVGPLDFNAYTPRYTGPSDLQRALALAHLPDDEPLLRSPRQSSPDDEEPPDPDALGPLLSANAEALRLAREVSTARAAGKKSVWWIHPHIDPSEPATDELLNLLRFGHLLHLAGEASLGQGDLNTALSYSEAAGLLGNAIAEQPIIIGAMFANSLKGLSLRTIRGVVTDPGCDVPCLDTLEGILLRSAPPDPANILATEGARLIGQAWPQATKTAGWSFLLLGGVREEVYLLDRWRGLAEAAAKPYEELDEHLLARDPKGGNRMGAIIADITIPNILGTIYRAKRIELAHDLARFAVAARCEAFTTGALPADVDPAAISTVARVTYRRLEDGSARLEAPGVLASLPEREPRGGIHGDPALFDWTLPATRESSATRETQPK